MKRYIFVVAFGVLAICAGMGVGARSAAGSPQRSQEAKEFARAQNEFAWDLYRQLKGDRGNIFFSPFSLRMALAMTSAGAKGDTARQMEKALRFTLEDETVHRTFAQTVKGIAPGKDDGYSFTIANSLWGQQDFGFLDTFLETCHAGYGGDLIEVDFVRAFEDARQKINFWVEDTTNRKIRDLIPPGGLNELTRLVLVNAIWFKGDWLEQFREEETRDAPFFVDATEKVAAPLMHRIGRGFRYAEADGVQILEMPYRGDTVAMVVLLPKDRHGIGELEDMLSAEKVGAWLDGLQPLGETDVYLPRFRMTYGTKEMSGPLEALGMVLPFDEGEADFSGMNGRKELFISAIFHKAFVDVNEEGTEAAAATSVVLLARGLPQPTPVFRADHPFVFLIREKASGSILFLGRMVRPEPQA